MEQLLQSSRGQHGRHWQYTEQGQNYYRQRDTTSYVLGLIPFNVSCKQSISTSCCFMCMTLAAAWAFASSSWISTCLFTITQSWIAYTFVVSYCILSHCNCNWCSFSVCCICRERWWFFYIDSARQQACTLSALEPDLVVICDMFSSSSRQSHLPLPSADELEMPEKTGEKTQEHMPDDLPADGTWDDKG